MMKGKIPYVMLALLGIALDLGTKAIAFHHLPGPADRVPVIRTAAFQLDWHHVENPGGMFGLGQGYGDCLRYFRLAALGIVIFFFLRARVASRLFMLSLALILAGAVGNLYDSFFNGGKVRDFIEASLLFMPERVFGKLFAPWPTFNAADSMILIGAVLLVLQLFRDPRRSGPAGPREREEAARPSPVAGGRA